MDQSIRTLPRRYSLRTSDGCRRFPTTVEVLRQYWWTVGFLHDRRNVLRFALEAFHLTSMLLAVLFFVTHLTPLLLVSYAVMTLGLVNVFNTIWYHRFCSHRAYELQRPLFAKLFLWSNPLGIREEIYAIMHHVHHSRSDEDDDPYGPHLGHLGSYLAAGEFEIASDLTEAQYARLKQRLAHVSMPFASLESFRRWRSLEYIPHYLCRWIGANLLWGCLWYALGGGGLVLAWYAAIFTMTAMMRSFNALGHAKAPEDLVDGWDFDRSTLARNQRLYGYMASEWHNNHHRFRSSANCAYLPGQVDTCFLALRLMRRLGIVSRYNDHRDQFVETYRTELAGMGGAIGPRAHRTRSVPPSADPL